MSSITFPHTRPGHSSSASSLSGHELQHSFYSEEPFDTASMMSFQMNPLSIHPPRTPRTSTASHPQVYAADTSHMEEETQEKQDQEEEIEDEEDKLYKEAQSRVRKEEVWREILKTSYGRDKTFKLMQYALRLYLMFHTTIASTAFVRKQGRPPWEIELVKRFESTVAGFSLARKCLILFNWVAPLTAITAEHSSDLVSEHSRPSAKPKPKKAHILHAFLHASPPVLLELVNGVSDDISTFSKIGLIGKRTGDRAGRFADWCWFASTLVGLVENGVERGVILDLQHQVESRLYSDSMTGATAKSSPTASKADEKELARLQKQDYWMQVTRMKLIMDLIFVSYNVFRLKRAKGSIQTVTGLASAALSAAKYYDRHKATLVKKIMY